MKNVLLSVFVCLLAAVLVLSSCTQNAPEVTPKAEKETAKPASPPKLEPKPASFSLSGLTISPGEVTSGSSVTIEVLVTNTGEQPGTYDVILKIDDTVEATDKVTLDGGASQKVTFTSTKFTAKTYSVSIDGQSGSFVVKVAPLPATTTQAPPPLVPLDAFKKGITFADWKSFNSQSYGLYTSPGAAQSLRNLAATGANWINLVVVISQENIASTTISRKPPATATDSELLQVINLAHTLGIRVSIMPMIVLYNDPSHFAGNIGTTFTSEAQWQDWFGSYRETINYYAAFAQKSSVDMFVIGHELGAATHREDDWRRIVQEVRQQFKGPITYSSLASTASFPHGEEKRITWWDAVDYIGIQAYYKLTAKDDPTVEELKEAWVNNGHIALLEDLSRKFNKPIIFTEIGYRSIDGINKQPANSAIVATIDLQEQADCYQAALEVLWGKPWLAGIFWWQWSARSLGGLTDDRYWPYGKPAEEVLKKYYLSQ